MKDPTTTMPARPTIDARRRSDGLLIVDFQDPPGEIARVIETEAVIDTDWLGDVVGVEILDLQCAVGAKGPACVDPPYFAQGGRRWAYDGDCDAYYLEVLKSHAVDNRLVDCKLSIDGDGRLARIEVATVVDD